jgi:short-subunit dehydrogenase involved in D-alanine esterification of teichoic acids
MSTIVICGGTGGIGSALARQLTAVGLTSLQSRMASNP